MSTLTLDSIRSIDKATIGLDGPITLLCGDNGAGKSSVLLALKACLTGSTACISTKAKEDALGMCGEGAAKQATATLDSGDGKAIAKWSPSKCYDVRTTGSVAGLPKASTTSAGFPDFLDMGAKERAELFCEAFQIQPTPEDLKSYLTQNEIDADHEEVGASVEINGWDGAQREAEETGRTLKAQWNVITGESWGPEKGESWAPEVGVEDGPAEQVLKDLTDKSIEAANAAGSAKKAAEAVEVPPKPGEALVCPCCDKEVMIFGGKLAPYDEEAAADWERLSKKRADLDQHHRKARADADLLERELNDAHALAKRADDNRQERIEKAAGIHAKLMTQIEICRALGPDGVRGKRRDEMLHLINGQLQDLAAMIGLGDVRLCWETEGGKRIPTICARLGDRLFQNLSRSEQWRIRLLVQILIAKRDGSTTILLDDCEILARQRREPLIKLLMTTGINVVAAMTISDGPNNAPDLAAAGIGQTYWIEDGQALPIADAKARAMKAAA